MTTHNTTTLRNELESLDRQIAEHEIALWDAVVLYNDEAEIEQIGRSLHDLRVKRIRYSHAYSTHIGQINGQ